MRGGMRLNNYSAPFPQMISLEGEAREGERKKKELILENLNLKP